MHSVETDLLTTSAKGVPGFTVATSASFLSIDDQGSHQIGVGIGSWRVPDGCPMKSQIATGSTLGETPLL
jgi:hypothetical protein